MDEHVGQIRAALEEAGGFANTIFIYTSDHGEALGAHGLWLKNNLLEPAAHAPLVIAGPGGPRGARVAHVTSHVDLVQFLLEWSGADGGSGLKGHSLLPLMREGASGHLGWAYSESHCEGNTTGSFMIRKGPWKYIHFTWHEDLPFNLDEDPGELRDLSRDPETRAVLRDLRGILEGKVDPEAITCAGFETQEQILAGFASELGETGLAAMLQGRMGTGLARVLAARTIRDLARRTG